MKKLLIKCPHCGQQTEYDENNSYRPFCSERCQLIDLGKWADEAYRVPGDPVVVPTDSEPNEESRPPHEHGKWLH